MSGVKHTRGPWRTNGCYISSDYGEVGHAYFVSSMPEGMADANAYLMAAAPDLLSVAKLALKTILDEAEARNFDPAADTNLVAELEAAITCATGDRPEKGGAL